MNPAELAKVQKLYPLSKDTIKRSLDGLTAEMSDLLVAKVAAPTERRIRQSQKPIMNKLEAEFYETIKNRYPNFPPVRIQAKTFLIANGCRYTPDFTVSLWPQENGPAKETAFEVKGKHSWDDAMVKLKVFASVWTEVTLVLVWKEFDGWKQQTILP